MENEFDKMKLTDTQGLTLTAIYNTHFYILTLSVMLRRLQEESSKTEDVKELEKINALVVKIITPMNLLIKEEEKRKGGEEVKQEVTIEEVKEKVNKQELTKDEAILLLEDAKLELIQDIYENAKYDNSPDEKQNEINKIDHAIQEIDKLPDLHEQKSQLLQQKIEINDKLSQLIKPRNQLSSQEDKNEIGNINSTIRNYNLKIDEINDAINRIDILNAKQGIVDAQNSIRQQNAKMITLKIQQSNADLPTNTTAYNTGRNETRLKREKTQAEIFKTTSSDELLEQFSSRQPIETRVQMLDIKEDVTKAAHIATTQQRIQNQTFLQIAKQNDSQAHQNSISHNTIVNIPQKQTFRFNKKEQGNANQTKVYNALENTRNEQSTINQKQEIIVRKTCKTLLNSLKDQQDEIAKETNKVYAIVDGKVNPITNTFRYNQANQGRIQDTTEYQESLDKRNAYTRKQYDLEKLKKTNQLDEVNNRVLISNFPSSGSGSRINQSSLNYTKSNFGGGRD
ncbi:hypothetical protein [Candidatus Deianiraea vastatrix]|uniref:Uncharacterized protein n=1 Tax=Candidatus Deianiraea vastatrix TaxID=2163644 RepID=A0A5B8XI36_9RICK|nr:hypothetical protein [Candidatus Deianiraea vastatrix]QED23691.1 hypothetical protein Deia_00904 [Candidatus Deianiraea vastatrix]